MKLIDKNEINWTIPNTFYSLIEFNHFKIQKLINTITVSLI